MRPFVSRALILTSTLLAAAALSACGGGGGGATSPSGAVFGQSAPLGAAPKSTLPPSSASRTAVATAHLTLKLPQALQAKGAAVHARMPAGAARGTASATRSPQYVNPLPAPSGLGYNILDIYVDNTLVANIDGNFPNDDHSMLVENTNADGTMAISLPLYSTNSNTVVAIEWTSPGFAAQNPSTNILAIGETDPGSISPGSSNNISLTMQMNAQNIGIVNLPSLDDAEVLLGQSYYANDEYTCPPYAQTNNAFALYPTDIEQTLVPIAGYGGTSTVQVTSFSSYNGGTSSIGQSPAGLWYAVFDASCDPISLNASAPNPANAIFTDINSNYDSYYDSYYYPYYYGYPYGHYQGIWNLTYAISSPLFYDTGIIYGLENAQVNTNVTIYGQVAN